MHVLLSELLSLTIVSQLWFATPERETRKREREDKMETKKLGEEEGETAREWGPEMGC